MAMESLEIDFALKGHFRINININIFCIYDFIKVKPSRLFWYVNSRLAVKNTFVLQLLLNLVNS